MTSMGSSLYLLVGVGVGWGVCLCVGASGVGLVDAEYEDSLLSSLLSSARNSF